MHTNGITSQSIALYVCDCDRWISTPFKALCQDSDLKDLGIPLGPRKKILNYIKRKLLLQVRHWKWSSGNCIYILNDPPPYPPTPHPTILHLLNAYCVKCFPFDVFLAYAVLTDKYVDNLDSVSRLNNKPTYWILIISITLLNKL